MDEKRSAQYVICHCQHCDGGIEFDAGGFEQGETRTVECPHCKAETELSIPAADNLDQEKIKADTSKLLLRKFYELARARFFGDGCEQDLVEAYKWVYIAEDPSLGRVTEVISKEEDSELDSIKDFLAEKLTPAQIREAHNRAALEIENAQSRSVDNNSNVPTRQAIPSEIRREVWRRDGGKCVKCGSREKLEYDHIIPVAKGGSNTARNIELLCEACNRSKSASIQ